MTPEQIKQQLREKAQSLDLPLFGITRLGDDVAAREAVLRWVKDGFAADMDWMADRRDIKQGSENIFPGARSIIVVGLPYGRSVKGDAPDNSPRGKVSLYASGRDYHRAMESRLRQLLRLLEPHAGTHKGYVDYGPVMEREYAKRAGLGFIGRNSCLINNEYGSFFFIATIVTSLDLPVDEPFRGDCGDCRRCVDACPTGALNEDGRVDSRLCISYHTIENRGNIPDEVKTKMGSRILGCDTCQLSCPRNNSRKQATAKDVLADRIQTNPDLRPFFYFTEDSFRLRFEGTVAMRPKHGRILRNVIIACGNSGNKELIPLLERRLSENHNQPVADALRWALSRLSE